MTSNIKKTIAGGVAGVLLAGAGGLIVDNQVVTDKEVHASINQAIIEGKIPQVDLSKVSLDRVATAYVEVAKENGVDLTPSKTQVDLYEKIRDKKANKGVKLLPKTNAVLLVQ